VLTELKRRIYLPALVLLYGRNPSPVSPARFHPETLVLDVFSKSYAMTGWPVLRLRARPGRAIIDERSSCNSIHILSAAPHHFNGAVAAGNGSRYANRNVADYRP